MPTVAEPRSDSVAERWWSRKRSESVARAEQVRFGLRNVTGAESELSAADWSGGSRSRSGNGIAAEQERSSR